MVSISFADASLGKLASKMTDGS